MLRAAIVIVAVLSGACAARQTIQIGSHAPPSPRLSADAAALAFRQGIEASALGLSESACPYSGDDARRAWRAGWQWAHGR